MTNDIQYYQGPMGPMGPQGPRGERGPQGERGNDGYNGSCGPRGATGERGPQGEQGPQGIAGPMGPQGPKGDRGEKGENGLNGARGPEGPQGPKGQDGTVSFDNLTDEQRESLRGPQGVEGPKGLKGDRGEIGPRGERGEQGEVGPRGPKGQDGTVTFDSLSQEQKDSLKGDRGPNGYEVNEMAILDIDSRDLESGTYRTETSTGGTFPHAYQGDNVDKHGVLEIQKTSIGTIVQEWHSIGKGRYEYSVNGVYTRTSKDNVWSPWKKLITRDNTLIRKEDYIGNLEEFAPIGGGYGKFKDTTLKKPNDGCRWGTVLYISENDGNLTLSQAGNLILMCDTGESAGKMYSRARHNNSWGEWREIGEKIANVFNHPEGRVDNPDLMKVNGYTLTDEGTEGLPGDPQGADRRGILKFIVQDGPTVKGSRAVTTTGIQMYTQTSTGESHTRNKVDGVWGQWKKVLMTGDIPTLPDNLMTHEKMKKYHNTHINDVYALKTSVLKKASVEQLEELRGQVDSTFRTHDLKYKAKVEDNQGKGGIIKLGDYAIQWTNNIAATKGGTWHTFDRLSEVYTVWHAMRGASDFNATTVGFEARTNLSNEYRFFIQAGIGNAYLNVFALGKLK